MLIHSNRFAFINYLSKALIRPEGRDLASENVRVYGKELFAKYGLPVPKGRMATTPEEAAKIAEEIGGPCVVKSQVLSGKRVKPVELSFPILLKKPGKLQKKS